MGRHYEQLDFEERCRIARLREAGQSVRQIAAALDRAPSSIARELKRNSGAQLGYQPAYAQEQTAARRWTGSRLERDAGLRGLVLGCLSRGWSPEQIAGWLRVNHAPKTISHESIYRFIYAQGRRTNNGAWRLYLPRAKAKRGWRSRTGASSASFIKDRIPISQRPEAANSRNSPGHWEADLMLFATYKEAKVCAYRRIPLGGRPDALRNLRPGHPRRP